MLKAPVPPKSRTIFGFLVLCIMVLILFYFMRAERKSDLAMNGIRPTIGPLRDVIIAKGTVSYDHQMLIRADSNGSVSDIYVKEGQKIRRGQPLIRLLDAQSEIELNLKKVELRAMHAKLASLNRELHVDRQLVAAGGLPRRDLEQKTLERDLAETDAERVGLEISRIEHKRKNLLLKSSLDGLVAAMPVVKGQLINAGDEAVSLSGGDARMIVAYIDALDIGRIGVGQTVIFSDQEDGGILRNGRIKSIGRFASGAPNQNSVKVVVEPVVPINDLLVSQQLYIEIIVHEEADVLRVPKDLVHEKAGRKFVYVWKAENIEAREVVTVQGDATYDKVVSGIDANDRLVREPALDNHLL